METLELSDVIVEPWGRSTRHSNLVYVPQDAMHAVGLRATCYDCVLNYNTKHNTKHNTEYAHEECSNHNCGRGVWMEFEDAISIRLGSKP